MNETKKTKILGCKDLISNCFLSFIHLLNKYLLRVMGYRVVRESFSEMETFDQKHEGESKSCKLLGEELSGRGKTVQKGL